MDKKIKCKNDELRYRDIDIIEYPDTFDYVKYKQLYDIVNKNNNITSSNEYCLDCYWERDCICSLFKIKLKYKTCKYGGQDTIRCDECIKLFGKQNDK